tara:strand:+ start:312 stop:428 length:117 start_codon:yes stop_codon:yes gene_type:complete
MKYKENIKYEVMLQEYLAFRGILARKSLKKHIAMNQTY